MNIILLLSLLLLLCLSSDQNVNNSRRNFCHDFCILKLFQSFVSDVDVAKWLRRSVSNHARSTRVGSNPVIGTTNHKPTVNSAVHPSEVGKPVNEYSEVNLRVPALDTH